MKTILAFGDSLTYGADAETGGRHAFEDRWPSVLEKGLDGAARVIAEGLGGRTTTFDDWTSSADLNGARILPVLLKSHQPLDAVVIMLGTNDLKRYVNGSALAAAMGMKRLAQIVQSFPYDIGHPVPSVVLVSPPHAVDSEHVELAPMFEGGVEESKKLAGHYQRVADELGCAFFDASTVAVATPLDGVHLDATNTRRIGEGLVPVVKSILAI
jgi:lysophospholipase L1-like esterase